MIILFINILLYLCTLIYYWRKDGFFSLSTIVFLLFTIFACAGYYTIDKGIYFDTFGYYKISELTFTPYLLNFFATLLIARSLKGYENVKCSIISINKKYLFIVELLTICLSLIHIIFEWLWYSLFSSLEMSELYSNMHTGEAMVFGSSWMNVLYFRSGQILAIAQPFVYLIEFLSLANTSKRIKPIVMILLIYLPQLIGCGISANRGGMIFQTASIGFFIIYFWKTFDAKLKNKIYIMITTTLSLSVAYLMEISISRGGNDSEKALNDVLRYFGEGFPNLCFRVWNADGHTIWGMRKFPTIYSLFGEIPNLTSLGLGGEHQYFEDLSGYPILNFKLLYGGLMVEFGTAIPFIIIGLYLMLLSKLKTCLHGSIFSLVLLHYAFMNMIWALFDAKIGEEEIVSLLVTFCIAYILNKVLIKRMKTSKYIDSHE